MRHSMCDLAARIRSGILLIAGAWAAVTPSKAQPCTPQWTQASPGASAGASMAYDSGRGVPVLYVGDGFVTNPGPRTYEWDGIAWQLRASGGPALGGYCAMAYDSARGVTVLVGVHASGQPCETWEWDGISWKFRTASGPPTRSQAAMTFDPLRGVCVLFGGLHDGTFSYGDTWEWDGAVWTQRPVSGPEARFAAGMCWDSARGMAVLCGGGTDSSNTRDTWGWEGTAWTQLATNGPLLRLYGLGFEPVSSKVILFGGGTGGENTVTTTSGWDGTHWGLLTSSLPFGLNSVATCYDQHHGYFIAYGGTLSGGVDLSGETWTSPDGVNWTRREALPTYYIRTSMAPVFDDHRNVAVYFGGTKRINNYVYVNAETWERSGRTWTYRAYSGPAARRSHAMAFDSTRGLTVLFGGSVDFSSNFQDTWTWDGTVWTQRASTGPSARYDHAIAYDAARDRVVLFGGRGAGGTLADTWEWDGASWSQVASSGPAARSQFGMAYDAARGVTVLFGGRGASGSLLGDTWEWNGAVWSNRPEAGPPARRSCTVLYDSVRHVSVMFGGTTGTPLTDVWEWNGAAWTLQSATAPTDGMSVFDRDRAWIYYYKNSYTYVYVSGAPSIVGQPADQSVSAGAAAVFSVSAQGNSTLNYQWRKDGVPLVDGGAVSGALTSSLSISPATESDAGSYDVVVTNSCGSNTSAAATLAVIPDCLPCDLNCNGTVNPFDIQPFLDVLLGGTPCSPCAGDANGNGTVNPFDINAFLACLNP